MQAARLPAMDQRERLAVHGLVRELRIGTHSAPHNVYSWSVGDGPRRIVCISRDAAQV